MPERFYFDLFDGETEIRDEEGVGAADLDEALSAAREIIAEMAAELAEADPDGSWTLIVRDGSGVAVGRLSITQ